MAKTLRTSVAYAGVWYRPGDRAGEQIPTEVAEKITNPKVWTYDDEDDDPAAAEPTSTTGARLVRRVAVAGVWYGPGDDVPDDVARRITNPKVWEDGQAPTFYTLHPEALAAVKAALAATKEPETPAAEADNADEPETPSAEANNADEAGKPASRRRRTA